MTRLLVVMIWMLAGCERVEAPAAEQAVRPAKLFKVASTQTTTQHRFVGRLDAMQTVDVSFEVDGALQELPIREGQAVSRGALVAALNPTDFQLAVREAEVQLRLATQDLERKKTLLRDRGISQSLFDDAQAQFELSQVRLSQAQERLAKSRIVAPFDAYVARRYVDNRTKVRVGDRILRLSDLNELKVIASLPEELVATVTPDKVVAIFAQFDFMPGERFPLTYRENMGEANAVAQTYSVTFTMARPADSNLLPGMTAQVLIELDLENGSGTLVIPTNALLSDPDGGFFVWIFDPASEQVQRRSVEVSKPLEHGFAVSSGLAPGDLLVAAGASQLQEGMRVRMMGEPDTALR